MPDEPFAPQKATATCIRGHAYNPQAGACPQCPENVALADALDPDGQERYHAPSPIAAAVPQADPGAGQ